MSIGIPCQLAGHHINDNAREDVREDAREEDTAREEDAAREEEVAREDAPLQSPHSPPHRPHLICIVYVYAKLVEELIYIAT